jgi:hypothetical protein
VRLVGSLRYRLNLGINYSDSLARTWTSSRQVRYLTPVLTGASLNQATPNAQQLLYENLLNYDGGFGDDAHRVSAVSARRRSATSTAASPPSARASSTSSSSRSTPARPPERATPATRRRSAPTRCWPGRRTRSATAT